MILALGIVATPAFSGNAIGKACLQGGRDGASRELCTCLQRVADAVLSLAEQRRGAQLFVDPHKSQELRASTRGSDQAFWNKWERFGATAEANCN